MKRSRPPEDDLFSIARAAAPPPSAGPAPGARKAVPGPELADGHPVYSVSQLVAEVKDLLESAHPAVYVRGEISGFRLIGGSGHMYFDLKDEAEFLNAAFFKGANRKLAFAPADGMEVVAFGRLSMFRSRCQIIVEHLEQAGLGALQQRIEELKRRLEAEGLFAAERKRPIPAFPHRIALVTSAEGAAVRDFLKVTRRRFPGQHIVLFPVLVQGEAAPAQIVEAIRDANAMGGFDVLVTCRGGGSLEDLMAFNDEAVARAIAASDIPVVNGVGHEPDVTIADYVADRRASTPSQAAEFVTPDRADLRREFREARGRMEQGLRRAVDEMAQALDDGREGLADAAREILRGLAEMLRDLGTRVRAASPAQVLARQREAVEQLSARLGTGAARRLAESRERMLALRGRLDALSPLAVLGRGYAIAFAMPDGGVLKDAASSAPGRKVRVRLGKGSLRVVVEEVE